MIHKLAENYLTGEITGGVPKQLWKLQKEYRALKVAKPIVEQFWGVSPDWKPMSYGWCVARTDAAVLPTKRLPVLDIVDHKTGREYEKPHRSQAGLYSAVGFALYPKIDEANVEFFYTDQGFVQSYNYSRAQLRYQVKYWQEQGLKLMAAKKFLPSPSEDACRWCGFRDDKRLANGKKGPCKAYKVLGKI